MSNNDVKLERLKLAVLAKVGPLLDDADVSFSDHIEFMTDEIYMRITGRVWAENLDDTTINYQHPCDWWQALKERFYPVWLLDKFPVKYKKFEWSVKAIYPEFKPKLTDQVFRLKIMGGEIIDDDREEL